MAQTVQEILAAAKKAGASDVHITVGIPPKMRVNGKLITMEGERLLPPDTMEIANSVMNDTQKQRFEDKGEVDMSFAIAGEGRVQAARLGSPGISSGGHSRAFAGGAGRARICH